MDINIKDNNKSNNEKEVDMLSEHQIMKTNEEKYNSDNPNNNEKKKKEEKEKSEFIMNINEAPEDKSNDEVSNFMCDNLEFKQGTEEFNSYLNDNHQQNHISMTNSKILFEEKSDLCTKENYLASDQKRHSGPIRHELIKYTGKKYSPMVIISLPSSSSSHHSHSSLSSTKESDNNIVLQRTVGNVILKNSSGTKIDFIDQDTLEDYDTSNTDIERKIGIKNKITVTGSISCNTRLVNTNTNNEDSQNNKDDNTNDKYNTNRGFNNTGHNNIGNYNHGNKNIGNNNCGDNNVGDNNIGDNNIGNNNIGNNNIGNNNVGNNNHGHNNRGDYNQGNSNIGHGNYGSGICGHDICNIVDEDDSGQLDNNITTDHEFDDNQKLLKYFYWIYHHKNSLKFDREKEEQIQIQSYQNNK